MSPSPNHISTFSIVAYDPNAQEWGVAVQSKAFAVGGLVPWVEAGVGAVATQAWVVKAYGRQALKLLRLGHDPKDVIQHIIEGDKEGASRQLGVVDAKGRAANYTGNECNKWAGGIAEPNVSVQGNILAGERVLTGMLNAFHKTPGKLADRLIGALEAGQRAGGDTRGQQSASVLVAREKSDIDARGDIYVDLRVDDHKTPIAELRRIYSVWERELYPWLEGRSINALLKASRYARAQKLHRDFAANAERLARKYSSDADFLNTLAWQFVQNQLGLDAALKYARRANKLRPKDANISDTLAEVWYQRGELERAIAIERDLVARYPDRKDLKQQLAKFEKKQR
jgi:uncharacterized Ntn-hydrolase superfamily protein